MKRYDIANTRVRRVGSYGHSLHDTFRHGNG